MQLGTVVVKQMAQYLFMISSGNMECHSALHTPIVHGLARAVSVALAELQYLAVPECQKFAVSGDAICIAAVTEVGTPAITNF